MSSSIQKLFSSSDRISSKYHNVMIFCKSSEGDFKKLNNLIINVKDRIEPHSDEEPVLSLTVSGFHLKFL